MKNNRLMELEFIISILNDLIVNYPEHHTNLLMELKSTLEYRRDSEEKTTTAKSKSEEFNHHKQQQVA